jgi:hypothetical protein
MQLSDDLSSLACAVSTVCGGLLLPFEIPHDDEKGRLRLSRAPNFLFRIFHEKSFSGL